MKANAPKPVTVSLMLSERFAKLPNLSRLVEKLIRSEWRKVKKAGLSAATLRFVRDEARNTILGHIVNPSRLEQLPNGSKFIAAAKDCAATENDKGERSEIRQFLRIYTETHAALSA